MSTNRIIEVIRRGARGQDGDVGLVLMSSQSSGFTAGASGRGYMYRCTAALTVAFDAAAGLGSGWHCFIYADGGAITLDPNSSETINGSSTVTVADGWAALVFTDNTNLYATFFPNSGDRRPGLEFIETQDASAVTNLDFTNFDNTLYDYYVFSLGGVLPATDGAHLRMLTSADGGSTFDNASGNYAWCTEELTLSAASRTDTGSSTNDTRIHMMTDIGTATGEDGFFGEVKFHHPHLSARSYLTWEGGHRNASGNYIHVRGTGVRRTGAEVDALRFTMSTGNIASGTITMYGGRNA